MLNSTSDFRNNFYNVQYENGYWFWNLLKIIFNNYIKYIHIFKAYKYIKVNVRWWQRLNKCKNRRNEHALLNIQSKSNYIKCYIFKKNFLHF